MRLIDFIKSIKDVEYTITKSGSNVQIHQTQRNKLKAELTEMLYCDIKEQYPHSYINSSGILLEIENDSIANSDVQGSGAITVELALKIKSLDCDAQEEQEVYNEKLELKRQTEKDKAKAKQAKIARDIKTRQTRVGS